MYVCTTETTENKDSASSAYSSYSIQTGQHMSLAILSRYLTVVLPNKVEVQITAHVSLRGGCTGSCSGFPFELF